MGREEISLGVISLHEALDADTYSWDPRLGINNERLTPTEDPNDPPTSTLQMTGNTCRTQVGKVNNVLIHVRNHSFNVDCVMLDIDMKADLEISFILGRHFMKMVRMLINIDKGEFKAKIKDHDISYKMAYGRSKTLRKRQSTNIDSYVVQYDEHRFKSVMYEQFYTELEDLLGGLQLPVKGETDLLLVLESNFALSAPYLPSHGKCEKRCVPKILTPSTRASNLWSLKRFQKSNLSGC
ncbi:unnamed protein product [Vicia faba]|uniref:Uncharacterized protein n=1 Tax=Vicia faba TaxID=3906 RepID=A0AAV0Z3H7_VICFA|nr:unnamed protein product [Vicia faba]